MLFSAVVLLAVVHLAVASPPAAQSTYCYEDNLLRAFQHTPTPASKYCTTATGQPTFIAATTYPPSRLSSACSCFSRFPTEPTNPPAHVPTPACYTFDSTGENSPHKIAQLLVTIDLGTPCKTGYQVTNVCGTFNGETITFDGGTSYHNPFESVADNCFFPSTTYSVDTFGFDFDTASEDANVYLENGAGIQITGLAGTDPFPGVFVSVSCSIPCPQTGA